ncbi:hypothetical protein SESBI_05056 [Sesbania bispinosa]|nr:hypothetical protein SESBI_05056 [Sesbania bispinosa]
MLGDGFTVRFWQDSFVSVVGPLLSSIPNGVFLSQVDYPMAAFADNGSWKWEEFQDLLRSDVLWHIASIHPPSSDAGADKPIWKLKPNGTFSIKYAYNFLQLWESNIDPEEWNSFFSLGLSQWLLKYLFQPCKMVAGVPCSVIFPVALWHIWKDRNQFIFQQKSELTKNLYFSINQYARRIATAAAYPGPIAHRIFRQESLIGWSPPPLLDMRN